jgi:hypothetical protein
VPDITKAGFKPPGDTRVLAVIRDQAERISRG